MEMGKIREAKGKKDMFKPRAVYAGESGGLTPRTKWLTAQSEKTVGPTIMTDAYYPVLSAAAFFFHRCAATNDT